MTNWKLPSVRGHWVVLIPVAVALLTGCLGPKHDQGRSSRNQAGQGGATNRYESSVAAEAQKTANTNAAPSKAADNTAQNTKEARQDTLTPMDQGDSDSDRRITQTLRKLVVKGTGRQRFSFSAKNIKIITVNGEVTLRGVVDNEAEKAAIEAGAQHIPDVTKVNNQLQPKHGSPNQPQIHANEHQ